MRRATIGSIVVLVLLAVLIVAMQQTEDQKVRNAVACQSQLVLIDYWKSVDLIRDIRQDGKDAAVIVDNGIWIKMPRNLQLQVGMAAYCPVERAGQHGVARIEDIGGHEMARVENGKWVSKAFPE